MVGGLYDCWPISGLTGYYNTRMAVPCYLDISVTPVTGASATSGTLTFSLATDMGLDTDAKLHAIINESGIPGTGTYSGSYFDYALRWNMGGANGADVTFGSSSETININLDYTIDAGWDWDELYLTTFVQSNATEEILNSHMVKLTDLISTGISDTATGTIVEPGFTAISPALGAISFNATSIPGTATMSLFSIDGRLVESLEVQSGFGVLTPENAGIYILRLETSNGFAAAKTVAFIK